ncbi:hypothetical protein J3R30DRAFT_3311241 [Lentinula aciculospora]|uniref:AB hydrolase-1 domain-containing protein n=1 Tax=Lentinula aciculospora TaxID=153920 RepID=A0A9W8ZT34_9AGAR|nr:hypothetical protein J3R30DRAFT_3311241 [Lentinula aciculospora]
MSFIDQILLSSTSNIVLSYLDSGPPTPNPSSYETIIIIHGNSFSNAIFKRLLPLSTKYNLRIIALSRRGFSGSTPFTEAERLFFTGSNAIELSTSDVSKTEILELRGVEILQFIDGFIGRSAIPPIQNDSSAENVSGQSRKGGLVLVGWSLGTTFSLSAIANVDSSLVSDEMRDRIGRYLRTHIMLEPALTSIGLPIPPEAWISFIDPNIPLPARGPLFSHLVTGYYDYSNETVASRNSITALGTIVPSVSRVPTIYTFTQAEHDEIVTLTPESSIDLYFTKVLREQLRKTYLKSCYDQKLRTNSALRNMSTVWEVIGDRSYSFVWPTFWEVEDDDMKAGEGEQGKFVRFMVIEGANHFVHWDEPEKIMGAFRRILDAS